MRSVLTSRDRSMTKKSAAARDEFRRFLQAGDGGLVVSFADEPDMDTAMAKARNLAGEVRSGNLPFAEAVLDVVPGFNNVCIQYNPLKTSSSAITEALGPIVPEVSAAEAADSRHWRMPVLYGGEGGPDLDEVAERTGLSAEEVVERHLARTLTVAIMGFMPGLGYLRGTDPALALPRRPEPRKRVPALSLGIVMDQCVIYPLASPGGWNLIGRVPVRIFDPRREDPVLFRPGDRVSFRRVDESEFRDLDERAAEGEAVLDPEDGADSGSEGGGG